MSRNGLPSYCLHRASGQARVIVKGRHLYLGPYGSEDSKGRYEELCRLLLLEKGHAEAKADAERRVDQLDSLTVRELALGYLEHAKGYYRKHGRQTGEYHSICSSLRPVRELFSDTLAGAFGPKQLKQVREIWIAKGIVREEINKRCNRIRAMFAWGLEEELLLPGVLERLKAVKPLKKGRSHAKDGSKVLPVPEEDVDATLPFLNRQVGAMVGIQRLTGMRPNEVCVMRTIDLDMSGELWVYRPSEQKTEHHDHERIVILGPRAIEILK